MEGSFTGIVRPLRGIIAVPGNEGGVIFRSRGWSCGHLTLASHLDRLLYHVK
ncbi:hypothetical protein [Nitrosomonas sp. Nm34]|uniref:hypothetical protein n=1 Tax=Nitrosomonas sp. Nm34 TaxID=1881055 RepID=UPI0015871B12|nr:hypothetical protein [Nitrosomonas sp. Nm34]